MGHRVIHYQNFTLEFGGPDEHNVYPVKLTESPAGTTMGTFRPPDGLADIQEQWENIRSPNTPEDSPWNPFRIGRQLCQALLKDSLLDRYQESQKLAHGRLRFKFRFAEGVQKAAKIHRLPWEFMSDPNTGLPLVFQPNTALIRQISTSGSAIYRYNCHFPEPLRVLVVIPNPKFEKGEMEIDRERILKSLEGSINTPEVEIDLLEKATLEGLKNRLSGGKDYHIVHLVTHGGFCKVRDEGYLCFEKDDRTVDYIFGDRLAVALISDRDLRLVNLFACRSGAFEVEKNEQGYGGVAAALAYRGFPAVLAMKFNILVDMAQAFTQDYYERILAGDGVETAMSEACGRNFIGELPKKDWGAPVLYLNAPSGHLFKRHQYLHVNSILKGEAVRDDREIMDLTQHFEGDAMKQYIPGKDQSWEEIKNRLQRLPQQIDSHLPVTLTGKSRLPIWLSIGYIFSRPSGVHLRIEQVNTSEVPATTETWDANGQPKGAKGKCKSVTGDANSRELVASFGISNKIESHVKYYLKDVGIRYRRWLRFRSQCPDRESIPDEGTALGMAKHMAEKLRRCYQDLGMIKVHLFIAAPSAFALFLGMELNSLTIQVYIYDKNDPMKYSPAMLL